MAERKGKRRNFDKERKDRREKGKKERTIVEEEIYFFPLESGKSLKKNLTFFRIFFFFLLFLAFLCPHFSVVWLPLTTTFIATCSFYASFPAFIPPPFHSLSFFCSLTSSNNDIHCHMLFLCFISRFHSPPPFHSLSFFCSLTSSNNDIHCHMLFHLK